VNDPVKRGQVLAQLDVSRLQDQIVNARGALAAARAQVQQAAATVTETQLQASRLRRMFASSGGTVPAQADIDTAEAALQRALAAQDSARAAVVQAQAALSTDETNLAKASIRSPIDGVVLTRSIEPGQTVAASLQAPVLFTLAEDLSKMELQVDVDEADVGQVRDGQHATFTVDAYPGREYPAQVRRVGFGSQTKDGVVSYLTVLTVNNDDLSLRPGMTATASIVVSEHRQVLLVPSAALRFAPASTATGQASGGLVGRLVPRSPHGAGRSAAGSDKTRQVWVLRNGQPVAVPVGTGASNGQYTEVTGGVLAPGMPVITESLGGAQ
jgi:HlyD family secretion protein